MRQDSGASVAWQRSWDDFVLRGFNGWISLNLAGLKKKKKKHIVVISKNK